MNYRFYHDMMKSYLIIACSPGEDKASRGDEVHAGGADGSRRTGDQAGADSQPGRCITDGYQYQMIAANNIPGLLPCSLRSINQEDYLYLDITSLQNIGSMFRERRLSGNLLRKVLWSLVETGESIARYLLDCRCILTDPRFIFYNCEADTCLYVYYPGEQAADYRTLFQFLADRIDPADKGAAGVIYQLCDLSENDNFILTRPLLERLIRGTGAEREQQGNDFRSFQPEDREAWREQNVYQQRNLHNERRTDGREADYRTTDGRPADHRAADGEIADCRTDRRAQESSPDAAEPQDQIRAQLTRVLMGAVLLLAAAAGAEAIHLRFDLKAGYDMAARGVAAAGAGGCILLACYGMILVWRKRMLSRETVEEQEPRMEPTLDFRKSQLCGGIQTGRGSGWERQRTGDEAYRSANTGGRRTQPAEVPDYAGRGAGQSGMVEGRMRTLEGGRNVVSYSLNDWDLP